LKAAGRSDGIDGDLLGGDAPPIEMSVFSLLLVVRA
jgi:hypothetical protein